MSPGQVIACYRLYAAHCIEIARELQDRGRKIALLNMAQAWMALADEAEKKLVVADGPRSEDLRGRSVNTNERRRGTRPARRAIALAYPP